MLFKLIVLVVLAPNRLVDLLNCAYLLLALPLIVRLATRAVGICFDGEEKDGGEDEDEADGDGEEHEKRSIILGIL
jgi:hypothetical protein